MTQKIFGLFLIFFTLFALSGCDKNHGENTIICINEKNSPYPQVISQILPSFNVELSENKLFDNLEKSEAAECFDVQAIPVLEAELSKYWYPQYLATVVIAVDRDKTDAEINTWSDLADVGEDVGLIDLPYLNIEMLVSAVSYGLDGEDLSLDKAMKLLAKLNKEKRLWGDLYDAPVLICFDYNAAQLIKNGKNIEIIVPAEGTLTYQRGLLSDTELSFSEDTDNILLSAGLRLLDGHCDNFVYPDESAYKSTYTMTDYGKLNSVILDIYRIYRRDVLRVRLYTSAESREHQYFTLIYIIAVVAWIVSVAHRVVQKRVRRAVVFIGLNLIGWVIIRLINYQLDDNMQILTRYLWFGYYLFQLTLPLAVLRTAWLIDKPDKKETRMPVWINILSAINILLIFIIFTNDLHNWVFLIDLTLPDWRGNYGYGFMFYFVQAGCYIPLAAGFFMILYKARQCLRKKGLIFLFFLMGLLTLYAIGYIKRVPIAWESDYTIVVGFFTLMILETFIQIGMLPVNSKYKMFFTHSSLNMHITDKERKTQEAFSSMSAERCEDDIFTTALESYPLPAKQDENTLIFAAPIVGGYAVWKEDITSLNRLHREIQDSVNKLKTANAILTEEEKIKRIVVEENAKTQLMTQLEAEIIEYTIRLSTMMEQLENTVDKKKATARIILLLCYIKRRCNLFFRERETEMFPSEELMTYLDELAEMAGYADVKIIVTNEIEQQVLIRHATLFYDFFNNIIYWATWISDIHILAHLSVENNNIILRLLPSGDVRSFQINKGIIAAVLSVGGKYTLKDLDDETVGISLSFPLPTFEPTELRERGDVN